MSVSTAAVEAAISKMQQQMTQLDPALEQLRQKVNEQLSKLAWPMGEALKWAWDKLVNLVNQFRDKVQGMLRNARVPFVFNEYEDRWLEIGSAAVEAASDMQVEVNRNGTRIWAGIAGGAYHKGVEQQPVAMDGITTKANNIAGACTDIRNAGYLFYIGMSVAVVSGVVAIATAGTVIPAIACLSVAVLSLSAAIAALLLETNAAAKALSANLGPGRAFPGNKWPQATTS